MSYAPAVPGVESRARRVLQVFGVVDTLTGVLCLVFADRLSDGLGLASRSSVQAAGALLIVLGIVGLGGARAPLPGLRSRLRIQAWLNFGFALVLIVVAVVGGADAMGVVILGVTAVAVTLLACVEASIAARMVTATAAEH